MCAPSIQLPTDILWITPGRYNSERDDVKTGNYQSALGTFCDMVRHKIEKLKIRPERTATPIESIVEIKAEDIRILLEEGFRTLKAGITGVLQAEPSKPPSANIECLKSGYR